MLWYIFKASNLPTCTSLEIQLLCDWEETIDLINLQPMMGSTLITSVHQNACRSTTSPYLFQPLAKSSTYNKERYIMSHLGKTSVLNNLSKTHTGQPIHLIFSNLLQKVPPATNRDTSYLTSGRQACSTTCPYSSSNRKQGTRTAEDSDTNCTSFMYGTFPPGKFRNCTKQVHLSNNLSFVYIWNISTWEVQILHKTGASGKQPQTNKPGFEFSKTNYKF
jgi:hypothetical protein